MRHILFLILIFAVSCSDNNPLLSRLDHIDSIMDANPQAAYDSLCTIKKTQNITSAKNVDMKWRMLMATAQNKLYMHMPTTAHSLMLWHTTTAMALITKRCRADISWAAFIEI